VDGPKEIRIMMSLLRPAAGRNGLHIGYGRDHYGSGNKLFMFFRTGVSWSKTPKTGVANRVRSKMQELSRRMDAKADAAYSQHLAVQRKSGTTFSYRNRPDLNKDRGLREEGVSYIILDRNPSSGDLWASFRRW